MFNFIQIISYILIKQETGLVHHHNNEVNKYVNRSAISVLVNNANKNNINYKYTSDSMFENLFKIYYLKN